MRAMALLLKFSRLVDWIGNLLGRLVMWLVLAAVLISAGNAIMRKAFNIGSNAYLEIQWYLFAGVFMLGAAYVLLHNAHVRIDFIASRLSKRTNAWIDAIGMVLFLIPLCIILVDLSWPFFVRAYESGEMSENAGGLIRWPVILLIPVGFSMLLLQAVSELIKRIAFLRGAIPEPFSYGHEKTAEEALIEERQAQEEAAAAQPAAADAAARAGSAR
jgi:TRAP-type mannitol/chloroaromatic compound transport system permease small subunit